MSSPWGVAQGGPYSRETESTHACNPAHRWLRSGEQASATERWRYLWGGDHTRSVHFGAQHRLERHFIGLGYILLSHRWSRPAGGMYVAGAEQRRHLLEWA